MEARVIIHLRRGEELGSIPSKPLPSIQKEIQLRHTPTRPIVLRQLLQQTKKRIFIRVRMRALSTGAQAARSLMIESVVRVVRAEVVARPGDAGGQGAEVEGRGEDALGESLGLVVGG